MDSFKIWDKELNLATIDIGTNTLLLLIAKIENNSIKEIITDQHKIARLGENVDNTGEIQDIAIERAKKILKEYKVLLDKYNVTSSNLKIIGTSALRDANNSLYVTDILKSVIGNDINIISGDDEALYSYLGSINNMIDNNIVIDIGGGSTEFISGKGTNLKYYKSLQIGAVRVTERFFHSHIDKTTNYYNAVDFIKSQLSNLEKPKLNGELIAVAGTPTTIAMIDLNLSTFDAHQVHNHLINKEKLDKIIEIFKDSTSEELVSKYNIHPNRADVILGGSIILNEFLNFISKDSFTVSCLGLRYGVLLDMLKTSNHQN